MDTQKPYLVVEWNDSQSSAVGWLVIDSLQSGAAGGGTRIRLGGTREEAEYLSKTMAVKFPVAGPFGTEGPIGGAKAVINYDPAAPDKQQVLNRFLAAMAPHLKTHWGTGGDLNTSEAEIQKALDELGIPHMQWGIVQGLGLGVEAIERLQGIWTPIQFCGKDVPTITVATGWGVAQVISEYLGSVDRKTVAIQGFGEVGGATAYFLQQAGARVVAVSDIKGMILYECGLNVTLLLTNRREGVVDRQQLDKSYNSQECDHLLGLPVDILVLAAASHLVTPEIAASIQAPLVVEGANNPFCPNTEVCLPKSTTLIPDFVTNAGVARVFAALMEGDVDPADPENILNDISHVLRQALREVLNIRQKQPYLTLRQAALELAQRKRRQFTTEERRI